TLYNVGRFPAVIPPKKKKDRIVGEVYILSDAEQAFRRLDAYEGCSPDNQGMYRRERITARLENGNDLVVWVYIWNHSVEGLELIPSGDYLAPTKA
ncbi:MAG: gamma-glutamylcyclotransferase, partial [Proteobacteria bacterium]|nr:gamma-glutamylcyclotransferase [Pseudomonadota bacterium]